MESITVETTIHQSVEKVWEAWTNPEHIVNWNSASPDWHCPAAENDLEVGGKLKYHMAARDGSMGFDYTGTFTKIVPNELLEHLIDDGRNVSVKFIPIEAGETRVVETFEAENQNSVDLQRMGWQAILDNFKKYAESI